MAARHGTWLLAVAIAACGRELSNGSPADVAAGTDAPLLDSTTDGIFSDSRSDVTDTADATFRDAGGDAPPWLGAWRPLSGAPECGDFLAVNPAESVTPLKWVPCASGRVGCRQLQVDWSWAGTGVEAATHSQFLQFEAHDVVRLVGGKPFFAYQRVWSYYGTWNYFLAVVQPIDGPAVVASRADFETRSGCFAFPYIGEGGVALAGSSNVPGGTDFFFMSWSPWAAPTDFRTFAGPSAKFGFDTTGFYSVAVGERSLFMEPQSPGSVSPLDMSTGTLNLVELPGEGPIGIHGGAQVLDYRAPYAIALVSDDGILTDVVRPSTGRFPTWSAVDRANGDAFVWVESDDTAIFANATLWTAPHTSDPAAVAKQKVALLGEDPTLGGQYMVANAGMALSSMKKSAIRLTRLSDGAGWSIAPEPGEQVARPLWVDDDEVWFATQFPTSAGPSGITRVRRDSLPSPDLGPGF